MLLFSFLFYKEYMCAFLYCKGLKPTFGIREVIGFKGDAFVSKGSIILGM
jgi:hypothetical protein